MKYVRELEEKELVTTERTSVFTRDGMKLNGNLMYHILPIKQAVWVPKSGGKQEKAAALFVAPVRFTAAGNAVHKPFLRVSCAVFLG